MDLYQFCRQLVDINGRPVAALVRQVRGKQQCECILAASPYAKQPTTKPYRVVLRFIVYKDEGGLVGKFIVHNQIMETGEDCHLNKNAELDHQCANSAWEQGDYFSGDQYPQAFRRWWERCEREVEFHKSLMRTDEGLNLSEKPFDRA